MLDVHGVDVRYGHGALALRELTLTAGGGHVTAVVGGNGAGKTTLMRLLSGVLGDYGGRCMAGEVRFEGRSLTGLSPAALVRLGITHVPEGRHVFGSLSVEENLRIGGTTQPARSAELLGQAYDRFPVLAERRRQRAELLSGGEQQMLAIARGMMSAPKVVLLDEPTLGLAPIIVEHIATIVEQMRADGTSVVIVEQNAAMALRVADTAYVLDQGRTTLHGRAADLRHNPTVKDLYLGGARAERPAFDLARCRIGGWEA